MTSSRVKVLQYPVAAPGKCVLCGAQANHDGRVYLDFGLSLRNYGAIYFCSLCMAEMVGELDWTSPEVTKITREANTLLTLTVQRLEAENEHLRRALAELNILGVNTGPPVDDSISDQDDGGQQGISDQSPEHDGDGSESGEQGSAKSADEQRRADLLGIDDLPEISISF